MTEPRRTFARVTLLAVLTLAGGARGAQVEPQDEQAAAAAIVEGRKLFVEGRYDEALPLLERGLATFDRDRGWFMLAVCLFELDRRRDEALGILRRIQGSADVDPADAARIPQLIADLEARQRRGTLSIEIAGAGASDARVFLDDRPVEGGGATLPVEPGAHLVRAEGRGCPATPARVEIAPRGEAVVRLRCELAPPRLAITTREPGMAVTVDGQPSGLSPLPEPLELAPGPHTVRLEKDGFVPIQRRVELAPGDVVTLELEPPVPEPGSSVWAWTTLGSGAALVGLGAGYFIHYGVLYADAQDPPADEEPGTVEDTDLIVGGIATGLGAALIVTSFFLWPGDEGPAVARSCPAVAPVPGGAVVGWSGTY